MLCFNFNVALLSKNNNKKKMENIAKFQKLSKLLPKVSIIVKTLKDILKGF